MKDLSRYASEEFNPEGVKPSDAATRAFLLNCADIYQSGGQQKIEFTADEFIAWYENEVEVIKHTLLNRIYTKLSK